MAVLGVQMMMLKDQVAEQGMWPVLQRIAEMDLHAVEVSQIPMDEKNVAELERGTRELGVEVGAISVALKGGPTATGDNLEEHFDKIAADAHRLGIRRPDGMMPPRQWCPQACDVWPSASQPPRLVAEGITLCYHNHHVDLRLTVSDLRHCASSGAGALLRGRPVLRSAGMAPLDMLKEYAGSAS